MKKLIISVLGQDRPGIIAAVSDVLYRQQYNIEDVSQTILQSSFSSIFIVTGPDSSDPQMLNQVLNDETRHMNMHYFVRELNDRQPKWTQAACESFVITTRGPDQKGLVAKVAKVLSDNNVNVTQLQAVFRGGNEPDRNVMIYEVDIPVDVDLNKLRQALRDTGKALHLEISIQHKNVFEAVNRI